MTGPASNRAVIPRGTTSHTLDVEGVTMRWEETGDGLPLVLIHGIPTSPAMWWDVVPRIRDARILNWEMVGHGDSIPAGIGRDISVGAQAHYLIDWLDALGIERAVLAAHDLGGAPALIAALRHPERCTALFLTNVVGYDGWPIPIARAMRASRGLLRRLPDPIVHKILRVQLAKSHDSDALAEKALARHWPHYQRHGAAAALARQLASMRTDDTNLLAHHYPMLDIPARLVWGTADRHQTVAYARRFAGDLDAPLTLLDGAGHYTPEDRPDDVADGINTLLEDLHQPPRAELPPGGGAPCGQALESVSACHGPARRRSLPMSRRS